MTGAGVAGLEAVAGAASGTFAGVAAVAGAGFAGLEAVAGAAAPAFAAALDELAAVAGAGVAGLEAVAGAAAVTFAGVAAVAGAATGAAGFAGGFGGLCISINFVPSPQVRVFFFSFSYSFGIVSTSDSRPYAGSSCSRVITIASAGHTCTQSSQKMHAERSSVKSSA